MSAPDGINKVDRLKARDGGNCWLCDEPIDFKAEPNSAKAWSLEHLIAQSRGGTSSLENLVLCHPPCNRQLGDRELVKKIKMREKRRRKKWHVIWRKGIEAKLANIFSA